MELIQGSETSANYNLMPGKYPEENIQYLHLCHLLVLSSPTLMMHGHTNQKLTIRSIKSKTFSMIPFYSVHSGLLGQHETFYFFFIIIVWYVLFMLAAVN